ASENRPSSSVTVVRSPMITVMPGTGALETSSTRPDTTMVAGRDRPMIALWVTPAPEALRVTAVSPGIAAGGVYVTVVPVVLDRWPGPSSDQTMASVAPLRLAVNSTGALPALSWAVVGVMTIAGGVCTPASAPAPAPFPCGPGVLRTPQADISKSATNGRWWRWNIELLGCRTGVLQFVS